MPATLRDVAHEAGVSVAAVSKVLNGRGKNVRVSESTANAIREAAQKLRYTPNRIARSLRTGSAKTVGLVFENFGEIAGGPEYYVQLLDGVSKPLFERGYRLTILPEMPADPRDGLCDGLLDGAIWCKFPSDAAMADALNSVTVPIVALNSPVAGGRSHVPTVSCDNAGGASTVAEHLIELGHRRAAFVLECGEEETPDAIARFNGFRRAFPGFDPREDLLIWDRGASQFEDWWRSEPPHTALFGWNERIGGAALEQAKRLGVEVPSRLSVVGFDSTAYCDQTEPKLTAVHQPIREMARHAAEALVAQIAQPGSSIEPIQFPCRLDVRASTARPPMPFDEEAKS